MSVNKSHRTIVGSARRSNPNDRCQIAWSAHLGSRLARVGGGAAGDTESDWAAQSNDWLMSLDSFGVPKHDGASCSKPVPIFTLTALPIPKK